ncbi:MAG: hypothetical protein AB9M60_10245 [Leptothrix sp. (in: b-proteobacteria)]
MWTGAVEAVGHRVRRRPAVAVSLACAWALSAVLAGAAAPAWSAPAATDVSAATEPPARSANELARRERQRLSARIWRQDEVLAEAAAEAPKAGTGALPWSNDAALIAIGERLYNEGRRANGEPLEGTRLGGAIRIRGADAACTLCHRRSGLGAVEGASQIVPISGRYLFDQDRRAVVNMNLRARKSFNPRHDPYTLDTLARALRGGVHENGRELDPLMPHYVLSDAEVLALASYLRRLSNRWSPGVSDQHVQLASVITPDVDPVRKRIFLDTVQAIVAQKNGNISRGQRTMSSGAEMALQTDRKWDWQVWELSGPASTWAAQLEAKQAAQPAFALASGLGAGNWEPVHRFCESQRLPCWFPSVAAVPLDSNRDFYSLYFSGGAGVEAAVLATQIAKPDGGRVLQVWADDGVAHSAVQRLRERLVAHGVAQADVRLSGDRAERVATLKRRLAELGERDRVALWLSPADLSALADLPVPRATVYASASLGGGDSMALPPSWRAQTRVLYPYQLPELRQRGLTYFREWLRIRNLALEDELLQSEVYFSLSYLNDTLVDMLDNVHRDYLLERGESMLSLREAAKTEDEARELSLPKTNLVSSQNQPLRDLSTRRVMPRAVPHAASALPRSTDAASAMAAPMVARGQGPLRPAAADDAAADDATVMADAASQPMSDAIPSPAATPESTSAYPRLSLGPLQRQASKGAYIVRFGAPGEAPWRVESSWTVP